MEIKLVEYMKGFGDFSEKEILDIVEELTIKTFSKDYKLLEQGDVPSKCYFILKGCIRQYGIDESGREVTYELYTEGQTVALFTQFTLAKPAKYTWICCEECVLVVGDLNEEEKMYEKHDGLESVIRKMVETNMGEMQEKHSVFISDSPEQRYKKIAQEREDLLTRVPQHQLASYLGITPESLSRIKRRIDKSKLKMVK